MESLNHDPNRLKTIIIEVDNFLIDRGYINFFMKMYMQRRKDDGSISNSQKLSLPRLPRF